jgi:hypothetical protein
MSRPFCCWATLRVRHGPKCWLVLGRSWFQITVMKTFVGPGRSGVFGRLQVANTIGHSAVLRVQRPQSRQHRGLASVHP